MSVDLLILAVLTKVLWWDLGKAGLTSGHDYFFSVSVITLALLLGLSSRLGKTVLKEGLTIATLLIFIASLKYQGILILYEALFVYLVVTYLVGKFVRLSRWWYWVIIGLWLVFLLVWLIQRLSGNP